MNKQCVVAIDGEGGAGKSTAIARIQNHFETKNVPTLAITSGGLYRALALLAVQFVIAPDEELSSEAVTSILERARLYRAEFNKHGQTCFGRLPVDPSLLRAAVTTTVASRIATNPLVRQFVDRELWRCRTQYRGLLLVDGRDTATVFPDAAPKMYLTVSSAEGARRLGCSESDIEERNQRDRSRIVAPMKPTSDAIQLDTTGLSEAAVAEKIIQHILQAHPTLGS